MNSYRRLGLGPVRKQRIGAAISIPLVVLWYYWADLSIPLKLVISLVGGFGVLRALAMGVEIKGDKLIIRNFISSTSTDITAVESAQLYKPRGGKYLLAVETEGGGLITSSGVSAYGRAFPELGSSETRHQRRIREKVEAFFGGTSVTFIGFAPEREPPQRGGRGSRT